MSSFLESLKSGLAIQANAPKKQRARAVIDKNPVTADLRIFKNGAVFPSASLVKRFNLEYTNTPGAGNGLDIIDSRVFVNTAKSDKPFLMIYPISKSSPKVDLFDSVRYENGQPLSNVMTQGSNTYGKQLLILLKEVYGIEIGKDEAYVDLDIVGDVEFSTRLYEETKGIYNVPKRTVRGEHKGTPTYVRRENISVYWLLPHSLNNSQANLTKTSTTEIKTTEEVVTN